MTGTDHSVSGEYGNRGDYHRHLDPHWRYYPVYTEKMAFVHDYLEHVGPNERILDLGCGEGVLVERYRKRGFDMHGYDLHYESEYVSRGDITQLNDVPNGSCDVVLALDVVEHLHFPAQEQAFAEMRRILKPAGRALVSLPNLAHLASRLAFLVSGRLVRTSSIDRHPGDRPIAEYLKLIEGSGFRVLQRKGIFPTYPLLSLLTYLAPARTLPLHRVHNAVGWLPNLCFLNLVELETEAI